MSLSDCTPGCCSTPLSTAVPGPQGNSSTTTTTASFVIPAIAIGSTVIIAVGNTAFALVGGNLFIGDGAKFGNFIIIGINSTTSLTVKFLGLNGDSAAGSTIGSGALVINGKGNDTVAWDLDALTAFTDNSGGTKSDTIPVTIAKSTVILGPFSMALLVNSQLWEVAIPYAFTVTSALFRCDIAITTGAKAATLTTRINGAACTGGVISVSGAYATAATQAATAITAGNTGTAGQTLEIAVSGVTAFIEGYGHVELTVANTDMTAFIAAIADKLATLRTKIRHQ